MSEQIADARPPKPRRDRTAYMRAFMRKKRAREKPIRDRQRQHRQLLHTIAIATKLHEGLAEAARLLREWRVSLQPPPNNPPPVQPRAAIDRVRP